MASRTTTSILRWRRRDFLVVALCAPIALSRLALTPAMGAVSPYMTTWVGLVLAAWLGGLWPAAVVGAVGFAAGHHVLVTNGAEPLGPGGVLIYVAFVLLMAIPGEIYQHMVQRRKADRRLLADMQRRLQRVARLNAMGELAGTLAHEINQPLTAIASYADAATWTLKGKPGANDDVAELLQKIVGQIGRARGIMTRVRGYVTGDELELDAQSLPEMFEEAAEMVAPAGEREGLVVRFSFDPAAGQVLADRVQIQQVMVNLIRNALEAMEGAPRRELRIGSRREGEGMVECHVADTGPGVPAQILDSLFQPFVSDKPDGTGIGLAVSRTIVEGHGGRIWAENSAGGGAVFRFTLKRASGSPRR